MNWNLPDQLFGAFIGYAVAIGMLFIFGYLPQKPPVEVPVEKIVERVVEVPVVEATTPEQIRNKIIALMDKHGEVDREISSVHNNYDNTRFYFRTRDTNILTVDKE